MSQVRWEGKKIHNPPVDTEKELRDAMRELERKAQAIHSAFPTSDKAEREIKKQELELKERLKQDYIHERLTVKINKVMTIV